MTRKYLFADESGNFDFRPHAQFQGATRYFAVGTLMMEGEAAVRDLRAELLELRDSLCLRGFSQEGPFHCTEDKQAVRDEVFDVLQRHDYKVDVTILEKSKAQPQVRTSDERFYQTAWFFHFKHFSSRYFQANDDLLVVPATLGTNKTRKAFRAAVEDVVTQCCPYKVNRAFGHWGSATDPALQAVDYTLWAVMRDVERSDDRSRKLIEDKIASVYDLWRIGTKHYY